MTEEKKRTFSKTLKDYFGFLPQQNLAGFAAEINALSEEEKIQIADGIEDGSFNY